MGSCPTVASLIIQFFSLFLSLFFCFILWNIHVLMQQCHAICILGNPCMETIHIITYTYIIYIYIYNILVISSNLETKGIVAKTTPVIWQYKIYYIFITMYISIELLVFYVFLPTSISILPSIIQL